MKEIPLTQGCVAIVDDCDYEELMQYKWRVLSTHSRRFYAVRDTTVIGCRHRKIYMHRQILGAGSGQQGDHANHDTLDNQRGNLRICTNAQNQMNARKRSGCSSQYKGVYWDKAARKWKAQIQRNGKREALGRFDDEHRAAQAYNDAAAETFGEIAWLNEINGLDRPCATAATRSDSSCQRSTPR